MNEREPTGIRFQLEAPGVAPVDVHLRRSGPRWVATVCIGERQIVAIGLSPRDALRVAFEPLGRNRTALLMADLGLLAPSMELLHMDAATVA